MTLFLLYLVTLFVTGFVFRRLSYGQRVLLMLALSVVVSALYFTLQRFI